MKKGKKRENRREVIQDKDLPLTERNVLPVNGHELIWGLVDALLVDWIRTF